MKLSFNKTALRPSIIEKFTYEGPYFPEPSFTTPLKELVYNPNQQELLRHP